MSTDPKRYRLLNSDKGFTLIEVLIALAIFSIGILAVANMQFWSVKNNTTGNLTTLAAMLARVRMEELKSVSDIATLVDGADPNNPIDADGNPGGIFNRSWTVTDPLGGGVTRRIEVTVSWNKLGRNRRVVLTTITRGNGT
jgi:type IV pilus assembly protein PilV